jgi:hypothetical protein
MTPLDQPLMRGIFATEGLADKFLTAVERGSRVPIDLTDRWNHWAAPLVAASMIGPTVVTLGAAAGGGVIIGGIALICSANRPTRVPHFDERLRVLITPSSNSPQHSAR